MTGYTIRIIRWMPAIESLSPQVYISNISAMGVEDPICSYLKIKGIRTVLWSFGINSFLFCNDKEAIHFRNPRCSHIISENLIVWNEHYKDFINEHPQNGLKIHVIGPLMGGKQDVMHTDRAELFRKFNTIYDYSSKYIAIFDAPPWQAKYRTFPIANSEEYNYKFMQDIARLASDFHNIILVYKPKRSLVSGKFLYKKEFIELIDNMSKSGKMIILDYNINPWIPIAVSDICISIPFESPSIAAIHYGKIGFFHDSENIALYHRYHDFPELVMHTYEQLKLCIRQSLYEKKRIGDIINEQRLRRLQGAFPRENSSEKFRDFLKCL